MTTTVGSLSENATEFLFKADSTSNNETYYKDRQHKWKMPAINTAENDYYNFKKSLIELMLKKKF